MGDELESLRATIEERRVVTNASAGPQPGSPHRRKRFLSYPRYVELMVTADAKMARHHGPNLEHYILTIMSVVSKTMFLNISLLFISRPRCVSLRSKARTVHIKRDYGVAWYVYVAPEFSASERWLCFCLPRSPWQLMLNS